MDFLLLALAVAFISLFNIIYKSYQNKHPECGTLLFTSFSCFFGCLFFFVSGGFKFEYDSAILPYVIAFGISYGLSTVAACFSIKTGSLSLTSLITSYSLVIPTMYGILFLNESVGPVFYIGLALLCVSLLLIGMKSEGDGKKEEKTKISFIWVVFVSLAFAGNGLCCIFQTAQQRAFGGKYKSELMVLALLIVSVSLFIFSFFIEKGKFKRTAKHCLPYACLCGIFNGALNLFVMMLTSAERLSAAVIFPSISGGGIVVTALVAIFLYRERLSRWQYLSIVLGTVSVVLMNL